MGIDKDTLHVVIRLPFRRPQGFIEPPSIVWTDEMEHKLWQYMSQKKTDWNYIAEQLGVPTSYVVRHAAFVYETQLRGIQQQLRINGNNSTSSRNSTKSPTPSKRGPTSIRYSNTLQIQQEDSISKESNRSLSTSSSEESIKKQSDEEDEAFSNQFERMRLQVEEPAFLPQKSQDPSTLSNSRQQLSMSIQNLRKLNTSSASSSTHTTAPQSPIAVHTAPGSSNESAMNSIGSSFSDLSDTSVTQSALEEAFLSKFNQGGSKMSLMNFSKRYRE